MSETTFISLVVGATVAVNVVVMVWAGFGTAEFAVALGGLLGAVAFCLVTFGPRHL